MAGFDQEKFGNFDPRAMAGFISDQIENFDPSAMAGFNADHFAGFDPAAMNGFDAAQVGFFDPQAVAGFGRDHVTGMELAALAGFDFSQVQNLDPAAKQGIGDKVLSFDDFDLDVRKELVDEPALRLGGVGSFDDLFQQLGGGAGAPPTPEQLQELGWDQSLGDIAGIDFGAPAEPGGPGVDPEALANALAAFELADLGNPLAGKPSSSP
jgi:hypothetical protein